MGKVVVSDTNIFIDLMDIGLLDSFFNCGMEIHTTAMVIDEIKKEDQKNTLLGFRDLMFKKYKVDEYAIKLTVGHKIEDITEAVYTDRPVSWLVEEISKIEKEEEL